MCSVQTVLFSIIIVCNKSINVDSCIVYIVRYLAELTPGLLLAQFLHYTRIDTVFSHSTQPAVDCYVLL